MSIAASNFQLSASSANGLARAASLQALSVEHPTTSILQYMSNGNLLITGPQKEILKAHKELQEKLNCFLLATDTQKNISNSTPVDIYRADELEIYGYLGAFSVTATLNENTVDLAKTVNLPSGKFDIVLDLNTERVLQNEVPPPGYYPIEESESRLADALAEIPEMIGSFDKPKFFVYDPEICAHGRSGIVGCTNCLESCPTGAISAAGEIIEVDPFLCQGQGTCATVCPTGAVKYVYPPVGSQLESIQQLVKHYLDSGGEQPAILLFDTENGRPLIEKWASSLPDNIIPVEVEEIGSIGLDLCLGAIAFGTQQIHILCTDAVPNSVVSNLNIQFGILNTLLNGIGYPVDLVKLHQNQKKKKLIESIKATSTSFSISPATFMPTGLKRTDIRMSLDYLYEKSSRKNAIVTLPEESPFGEIKVNRDTCTLCMACVSVCPSSALEAGGDTPKLSFIEENCVQCGLCETACPESAINRYQRYVFNHDLRMNTRTLNEDSPVHCVVCGTPFATRAILERMKDKLKDHWMFQNPDSVSRLEMCENCRVKDMFEKEASAKDY